MVAANLQGGKNTKQAGIQMRKYSFEAVRVEHWQEGESSHKWQVHNVHLPYLESINVRVFTPASVPKYFLPFDEHQG